MAEEEKKGLGTVPPASGELSPEDGQPSEIPQGGSDDLIKTIADKEEEIAKLKGEQAKTAKQLNQAGFNIQKLKKIIEDNGIEIPPENENMSAAQFIEVIKENNKTLLENVGKQTQTQISEALRTISAQSSKTKGGEGNPGQEQPLEKGMPKFSDSDQKIVNSLIAKGYKWDAEQGGLVSPKGVFHRIG